MAELIEFFKAVKAGGACGTTRSPIYEGYKTMVLYEAIRDSATTGEIIRVQYEFL